jgi:L-asparaginase II
MSDPVLIEVTRGEHVESSHRGAIVVVDAEGRRRAAIGDVEQPVFPRSAVKAIQALPLIESGAADAYSFRAAELALACASHGGEQRHVNTAAAMLARAGRSEADLECGVHTPLSGAAADALVRAGKLPGPLHNNCSGKHSGFICFGCHAGFDPHGYVDAKHPVQREVTATLAAVTGAKLGPENRATDGCSIPTYAIPLAALAHGFARFVTGEGLPPARAAAARRLRDACMSDPFMVAGTGRFCTDTMDLFRGRVFVKTGAEGVFCAAFPESGLGVALKCDDGAGRAAETAMAAVIDAFLPMDEGERHVFARRRSPPIMTRRNVLVGHVRPVSTLVEALREGRALTG